MLIQIPVTITFDAEGSNNPNRRPTRVFTLRYDTEDGDKPADYCMQYPAPVDAYWFPDTTGILVGFMSASGDKAITASAARDPESYAAQAQA